jgi:hypothetical protein
MSTTPYTCGPTNPYGEQPMICGETDPAKFDARYVASREPEVRAVINDYTAGKIGVAGRQERMSLLAKSGILIDAQMDAFIGIQSTPWTITLVRCQYGVTEVHGWNGDLKEGGHVEGILPVPPNLTPIPDPVGNEFVDGIYRTQADYTAMGIAVAGDVYNSTPRGDSVAEGLTVTEPDGYTYQKSGQLTSGDPISLWIRLPK